MKSTANEGGLVFLSYHSADREKVREFVGYLERAGVHFWFDQYIRPGGNSIAEMQNALRSAAAVLVLVGPSGLGPWQSMEISATLVRVVNEDAHVIPVLLPGAHEPDLPLFLECFAWVDMRSGYEQMPKLLDALPFKKVPVSEPATKLSIIIATAKRRLILSGHTLEKFNTVACRSAILECLDRGVRVSVLQLNPLSKYAAAHRPYHFLESTSSADEQHQGAIQFFSSVFESCTEEQKDCLEVLFSNYMPRFRAVIADQTAYLFLYMYGIDVPDLPDLRLVDIPHLEGLRRRTVYSTYKLLNSPEIVPYIRGGQIFTHWAKSKVARWDSWTNEERSHHRITHNFYVTSAVVFDKRFGVEPEREISAHLDRLSGRLLALGCGSGKEVRYLAGRAGNDVYGIDFSPVAINIARTKHPDLRDRLQIGDFYDIEYILPGLFDGIVANAAFVHLYHRDDINELLKSLYARLSEGGHLFLRNLYKEHPVSGVPMQEEVDSSEGHLAEWDGLPRWFVYFSRKELAERCRDAGFEVLNDVTEQIAREQYNSEGANLKDVMEKGFHHRRFRGIYWPTLLLRKRSVEVPASVQVEQTGKGQP